MAQERISCREEAGVHPSSDSPSPQVWHQQNPQGDVLTSWASVSLSALLVENLPTHAHTPLVLEIICSKRNQEKRPWRGKGLDKRMRLCGMVAVTGSSHLQGGDAPSEPLLSTGSGWTFF